MLKRNFVSLSLAGILCTLAACSNNPSPSTAAAPPSSGGGSGGSSGATQSTTQGALQQFLRSNAEQSSLQTQKINTIANFRQRATTKLLAQKVKGGTLLLTNSEDAKDLSEYFVDLKLFLKTVEGADITLLGSVSLDKSGNALMDLSGDGIPEGERFEARIDCINMEGHKVSAPVTCKNVSVVLLGHKTVGGNTFESQSYIIFEGVSENPEKRIIKIASSIEGQVNTEYLSYDEAHSRYANSVGAKALDEVGNAAEDVSVVAEDVATGVAGWLDKQYEGVVGLVNNTHDLYFGNMDKPNATQKARQDRLRQEAEIQAQNEFIAARDNLIVDTETKLRRRAVDQMKIEANTSIQEIFRNIKHDQTKNFTPLRDILKNGLKYNKDTSVPTVDYLIGGIWACQVVLPEDESKRVLPIYNEIQHEYFMFEDNYLQKALKKANRNISNPVDRETKLADIAAANSARSLEQKMQDLALANTNFNLDHKELKNIYMHRLGGAGVDIRLMKHDKSGDLIGEAIPSRGGYDVADSRQTRSILDVKKPVGAMIYCPASARAVTRQMEVVDERDWSVFDVLKQR